MGPKTHEFEITKLPPPRLEGRMSVEKALSERRSVRDYRKVPVTLAEIGQLLWAAQGITSSDGLRAAPSAGALYPLDLYLVAGGVEGLTAGVYRYVPEGHSLLRTALGDLRARLCDATLGQECVKRAQAEIVFTAVVGRTTAKYGERGSRYVHMDAGFAGENVYLQAVTLGLGTVVVGAFDDEEVKRTLSIEEEPLIIMPIGRK